MIESCVFTDEISHDFEEAVRTCAELKVRYIEPRAVWDTSVNQMDMDGAKKMKKVLDQYGVKVGVIGSGFGKCSLDDEDQWTEHLQILERQFRFCDLFETRVIRGFPFWVPGKENWRTGKRPKISDYIDRIAPKMSKAASMAEKEGVTISLETEPSTWSGSCEEAAAVVDAVGSSGMSVCWDVANSWHFGVPAYPEGYNQIKSRVTHMHIKDIALDPKDRSKPTGSTHIDLGDIPYHDIFRTLIADGYDGLASVETHLFFRMADRFRWLKPATEAAMRNLNRVLAEVQGGF
jgi:sugar phosphate isomerase/epimerase